MAVWDKLSNLGKNVGGRANNAIENGKLGLKINGEEKKITEYTLHIGELMVDKLDNGEVFDDEIAALYSSILASREVVAAARAEIEVNKQENETLRQQAAEVLSPEPACPQCGAAVAEDAKFCPQCGAKIEPPAQEQAPAAEPAACPACGTKLAEDDKFCKECGTPVESAPAEAAPEGPAEKPAE